MLEGLGCFGVLKKINENINQFPNREFTAKQLHKHIELSPQAISGNLARLVKRGLLVRKEVYRENGIAGKRVYYTINYDRIVEILLDEDG